MNPEPSASASRLAPEPLARRDFLGLASLWAAGATLLFAFAGMLRLPKAAVLPSPSRKFQVHLAESLAAGEPFLPSGHAVALFRDTDGVWAVSRVCTHLGCIVKENAEGFECPCHGSRFAKDGTVLKGPAPTPLPWLQVTAAGGAYLVDEGQSIAAGTKV